MGRLVEYEVHFDRYTPVTIDGWWDHKEPGAGILFDLGPHLIDQTLCLFGLPITITADIRTQRENSKVDDYFKIILSYDNLKVTLKAGMFVREPGPHFVLHGTEGSFVKYRLDPREEALKQGVSPLSAYWGEDTPELWGTLNTQIDGLHYTGKIETIPGSYARYYENIYDAIVFQKELLVKPEEAMNTIRIIELAFESNEKKCTINLK